MDTQSSEVRAPGTRAAGLAAAGEENPHHARRWWILVVLALAQLMVVLDTTVVNIALPSAQHALGFSNNDRQWIVTAYSLAFGSLLLLGGKLGTLFGRKRLFLIGLAGFAVASAVGGASNGFVMLVIARTVQGLFGALLAPAGLSLLTTTFTEAKERSRAFGIYGAIAGGGAGIGLLLGGVLTEYLSWRWCMYVNLIFAVAALVGGMVWLRNQPALNRSRLDIPGVVLVSAGLFALVYGFSHAETGGWGSPVTIGFLAGAVVLLAAFVAVQARTADPVMPLRVVLDRNRGGSYVAILLSGIGMFGMFLFLTYYLQENLAFSAVKSGLAFLPMIGVLMVSAQVGTNTLTPRIGPKFIIAPGLALAAVGTFLLTSLGPNSDYVSGVLPAIMVIGAGLGLVFSCAMSLGTAGVPAADAGAASALVTTVQQIGGSIGTALLNTIAASAATSYAVAHAGSANLSTLSALHSYTTAFWWAAGILLAGAVVSAVVLPARVTKFESSEEILVVG
jgi:EmrB/QacA subfamily drug resistance transporter